MQLIFPAALLSLADEGYADGRAWWKLSIQRLLSVIEQGQYDLGERGEPTGHRRGSRGTHRSRRTIAGPCKGLGHDKLLLGGFSQGAMLSMEVACLGLKAAPAAHGFVFRLFDPTEAVENGCRAFGANTHRAKSRNDGSDPCHFAPAYGCATCWLNRGCQVDFMQFQGPHTIAWEAIEVTARFLDDLLE